MNNLPNEMIFEIFSYLGIKSLAQCRLTSKRWCAIVDKIKIKELIFNFQFYLPEDSFWYSTDHLLDIENRICGFDIRNLPSIPLKGAQKLQRLKIGDILVCDNYGTKMDIKFHFNILNKFASLEHLEIPTIFFEMGKDETLSLPNLKVICIDQVHSATLSLDTPKLEIFASSFGLIKIKILHPLAIKHLQVRFYQGGLNRYSNLKILKIYEPQLINQFRNIFKRLPNLEELHLVELMGDEYIDYDETCVIIDRVLRQKQNLTNRDVKIYFLDYLLDDNKRFHSYRFDSLHCSVFGTCEDDLFGSDDSAYLFALLDDYIDQESSSESDDE